MRDPSDLTRSYAAAVWDKDAAALDALYAEDAEIYDLWAPGRISDRREWTAAIRGWLGGLGLERVRVEAMAERGRTGGDLAWVHALLRFSAVDPAGAVLRSMVNRFSWGLERRGGNWLVVHQHSSLPIDGGSLRAVFPPD